jgi:hypothetical protein
MKYQPTIMKESSLTGEQSLEVIQSMILKAKNQFGENGQLYLLWGWVVLFCSLGYFVLDTVFHYPRPYLIWMTTWLAVGYMFFYLQKEKKRRKVKTYTEELLGFVWIAFVVLMILGAVIVRRIPDFICTTTSLCFSFTGIPYISFRLDIKIQALIYGGIFCWVLAFSSSFYRFSLSSVNGFPCSYCSVDRSRLYSKKKFLQTNQ